MRYITINVIYRFLVFFFFKYNSSRNPNYRTLISYESRAWDFIHFSNVPHVVAATRRSIPPPPDISRTRFPELDTRHRRRNPPPLETGRRWRRRPGTRMPRSACERFSRFLAEDVGQRARRGCSCASKNLYIIIW